jgi:3-oxoacyl-[acyl-carrier-protein] synthase II
LAVRWSPSQAWGVVSSLGQGVDDNWTALTAGQSGIHRITRFSTEGLSHHHLPAPSISSTSGPQRGRAAFDIRAAETTTSKRSAHPGIVGKRFRWSAVSGRPADRARMVATPSKLDDRAKPAQMSRAYEQFLASPARKADPSSRFLFGSIQFGPSAS